MCVRIVEQLRGLADDARLVCAHQFNRPGLNRFGTLRLFAQHQDWFAQRRSLLLHSA